ncbi:hypothetical protein KUTeg_007253 [Tegillarca granosa]|uniref:KHDC4/BBP-like KH-domain type I domain-containing protein n=1 Tax=Tegillarca granosa TaxID=220873 RepID=A0ABQ9FHB2_TEGGR|nr:hypothetical protein KUTeg_007253 [Tegillarca granosa]
MGPRGMTAKELEQFTGCKIMVRGKGSMRDKKKEDLNRGKANWEHLNEELHVLITVEDTRNRAEIKIRKAVEEVKKLLVPAPDGEDDLKKRQLMELAIINGTYRDTSKPSTSSTSQSVATTTQTPRFITAPSQLTAAGLPAALRSPTPAGAPIILAPRMQQIPTSSAGIVNGPPPPLVSAADTAAAAGLMYNPYEYPYAISPAAAILEYQTGIDQAGGMFSIVR